MVTMRQEDGPLPTTTQGEAIGRSFPLWTETPRQRESGTIKEELGSAQTTFLIPKVRRPPQPHVHQKGSFGGQRESCQGMFCTHTTFQ